MSSLDPGSPSRDTSCDPSGPQSPTLSDSVRSGAGEEGADTSLTSARRGRRRGRKRKRREVVESDSDGDEDRDAYVLASRLHEYQWPLDGVDPNWCMLQEQVAEFLDIRGMQRRYPDLERRNVDIEEKKYLLEIEAVTETQSNMGLVALNSEEVLALMAEDFPSKYKEYLDYLAEKQFNAAVQKTLDNLKRLAESEVTREVENRDELLQQSVKMAVQFNSQCAQWRKSNREKCIDTQTKIAQVPRSTMKPAEYVTQSRYPVALLPGQYCDNVRRYTSEELFKIPLLTATKPDIKPPTLQQQPNSQHSFAQQSLLAPLSVFKQSSFVQQSLPQQSQAHAQPQSQSHAQVHTQAQQGQKPQLPGQQHLPETSQLPTVKTPIEMSLAHVIT